MYNNRLEEVTDPTFMESLNIMVSEYYIPVWLFLAFVGAFLYHVLVPDPKKKKKRY